jgi:hypothetical protein
VSWELPPEGVDESVVLMWGAYGEPEESDQGVVIREAAHHETLGE